MTDVFNRIKNGGGFWSGDVLRKGALAIVDPNALTITWDRAMTPLITGASWQQHGTAINLIHELTHVFTATPNSGIYDHLPMAQAGSAATVARNIDLSTKLGLQFPIRSQFGNSVAYDHALSNYFNKAVGYACRKAKI